MAKPDLAPWDKKTEEDIIAAQAGEALKEANPSASRAELVAGSSIEKICEIIGDRYNNSTKDYLNNLPREGRKTVVDLARAYIKKNKKNTGWDDVKAKCIEIVNVAAELFDDSLES